MIFELAIGRFSVAIWQSTSLIGHPVRTMGISVWMGAGAIISAYLVYIEKSVS